jgi:ADP-heptose:LPS heptosyltransferase
MSFKNFDKAIRSWNHRRIDFLRKLRLQITKKIFDHRRNLISPEKAEKNILVFRLDDKLGDAIVSTGFLKSIKSNFKDHHLTVLAGPQTAEIYKSLSFIDEVVVCKKGFGRLLKVYFYLKKKSYKYIVNTSHILSPRVVMLLSALKGSAKIGFLNSDYQLFSGTAEYDEHRHHVLIRYRQLIELMGVESPDLDYVLELNKESVEKAKASIAALKRDNKKIVLLNSFAGARLRNFSKETSRKVIEKLTADGQTVVISVANAGDHRIVSEWRENSKNSNWIQLKEFSSLNDNLALLSLADLVITPDTAWVHMASALGRNLVAVYREDTEEKNSIIWAPAHKNSKVVIAPNTLENPYDINNVSVDEVVQAAKSLLGP